jgi:hypothetical protein
VSRGVATKVDRRYVLAMAFFLVVFALVLAAYLYERSQNESLRSELSQNKCSQSEGFQISEDLSDEDRESVALYSEVLGAVRDGYVDREAIDSREQTYGAIRGISTLWATRDTRAF